MLERAHHFTSILIQRSQFHLYGLIGHFCLSLSISVPPCHQSIMTMGNQIFGFLNRLLLWSLVLRPHSSLQVLVPVLLPTDSGAAEAAKEGVTPAPASGHGEDNTLAYTGTVTAASSVHSWCLLLSISICAA